VPEGGEAEREREEPVRREPAAPGDPVQPQRAGPPGGEPRGDARGDQEARHGGRQQGLRHGGEHGPRQIEEVPVGVGRAAVQPGLGGPHHDGVVHAAVRRAQPHPDGPGEQHRPEHREDLPFGRPRHPPRNRRFVRVHAPQARRGTLSGPRSTSARARLRCRP
jgi:hypothetical protein